MLLGAKTANRYELLDEIARLRAEVEQLRAALAAKTLRAETVRELRACLLSVHGLCVPGRNPSELVRGVLADLNRCYPPEEE